jgi:Putative 2OG-Fe(II) oxygenase
MEGDAGPELGQLKRLVDHDGAAFREYLVQVAIKAGDGRLAEEQAQLLTQEAPINQAGWAYLATAWRMLGDEREFWLCDYAGFVDPMPVCADGFEDHRAFAQAVSETLLSLHQTQFEPGDQSLRNGTQTSGALFDRRDPMVARLKQALADTVNQWVAKLPDDPDHPFLKRKTGAIRFSGSWSVKLRPGGFHVPHFHGDGWISSAYYAHLPSVMTHAAGNDEGCIAFGQPPAIFGLDHPPRRIIVPSPGTLALFPSYMWHGTIPFSGDETRLTAAFDMVPR